MKDSIFITNSPKETKDLAKKIAEELKTCNFIALYGDLGSGKTTFVQGFAEALGIKKRILSPTFILLREYKLTVQSSRLVAKRAKCKTTVKISKLYHIDLYRIESQNDVKGLGIEEILNDPQAITVIEWAERMGDLVPKRRIDMFFEYLSDKKRKITIKYQ